MEDQNVYYTEKGGKGWLFFALIPAALAGAALMWLAFYTGVIDWTKTMRIEGRMDARVGVRGELTAPVDLIIRKTGCLQISRAFLDSGSMTAYTTNSCHAATGYWELHWNEIAPDGTVIHSGYTNQGGSIEDSETREMKMDLDDDSRTVKVVTWAQGR